MFETEGEILAPLNSVGVLPLTRIGPKLHPKALAQVRTRGKEQKPGLHHAHAHTRMTILSCKNGWTQCWEDTLQETGTKGDTDNSR